MRLCGFLVLWKVFFDVYFEGFIKGSWKYLYFWDLCWFVVFSLMVWEEGLCI